MNIITRSSFVVLSFGLAFVPASKAHFESKIFTYDDPANAKNLHVSLKGTNWYAKEVTEQDIPFHQQLFNNSQVMAGFADGQVRTPESTEDRLRKMWISRFQNGQPHGGLTVFNPENQAKFGHVVAGGGDGPGVSEIAYSYLPEYWGKKVGSGVVGAIVQEWAPEVRRIGLGNGLDELQDMSIVNAFKCFGKEELKRLDATASPSNPGSWKILDKYDFKAAAFKVPNEEPVANYDQKDFESFNELENHVLKLFDVSADTPLKIGTRYRLIDPDGKVRTFSKHEKYDRLKYHFERGVE